MALLMLTKKEAIIIVDRLSRCMQTFYMPRISRTVATGFRHHITHRENYQQCGFEDKDGFISRIEELLGRQLKALSRGGNLVRITKWLLSVLVYCNEKE